MVNFVSANPKAFFGIELIHVWTVGAAPYLDEKFRDNFRIDSFFISLARRRGLLGFAAEVLVENKSMLNLFKVWDLIRKRVVRKGSTKCA
jgi:hypothetical protein